MLHEAMVVFIPVAFEIATVLSHLDMGEICSKFNVCLINVSLMVKTKCHTNTFLQVFEI